MSNYFSKLALYLSLSRPCLSQEPLMDLFLSPIEPPCDQEKTRTMPLRSQQVRPHLVRAAPCIHQGF